MGKIENEPALPPCLGSSSDSLVFAPTAGMRLAPEVLVFELFRELGYGDSRNPAETAAREFSDVIDDPSLSEAERLLLSTCRGRQKKTRAQRGEFFYAPPYLGLARHAWLRKRTDRTIRDYFLGGPLAHEEARRNLDKDLVVGALLGQRSAHALEESKGKEILSLLALDKRADPPPGDVLRHLGEALRPRSAPLAPTHADPLAVILAQDFLELCRLEARIARREWLFFLVAFLRVATTMWMLAHLRITVMVRDWLLDAALKEALPAQGEMRSAIQRRHEGTLHPSSSPTREVFEHVETYMRARVELRLLVREVEKMNAERFTASTGQVKTLSLDRQGAGFITLGDLLTLANNSDWTTVVGGLTLRQWLTREAEQYPAWRSPRTRGQGKNIDEFIRVLYRSADDDSGSGLLIRCQSTTTKIVPGHRLLQLFAFLAAQAKVRSRGRERGKLVLRDIEAHLYDYGIDFRSSSFGRPLLIQKLMEGGFLVGSPDAGESAEVLNTVGAARSPA
jgi:hypothetical protein